MQQILRSAVAFLAMSICLISVAVAMPPAPHAPHAKDGHCPGMIQITPEQRAKYYAITEEFAPKIQEVNDQIFIKKNELEALKHAVQPDVAAVRAAATELTKLRGQRRDLQKALRVRLEKECGIVRPAAPIPGVDRPFGGPRGPHGPHGPYPGGDMGPHGPCPGGHMHGPHGPHGPCPAGDVPPMR